MMSDDAKDELPEYKRDNLPPLERAVSDALDEWLWRIHGVMSGWAHPHEFIDWLKERGYAVIQEQRDSDHCG
jgi:hypothetical protein